MWPWGLQGHGVSLRGHLWSHGTPKALGDPSGLGGHLRALGTPRDMACPWGTPLVPQDLKGFGKPKRPVPGGHPSPWGHLQTLGTLRDTSCPWGTPLLRNTPKGMFQVISGGPRTWGHRGLRATRGALGMLQTVSPSPGDTGVPAGHRPGIPSIGPLRGVISAAARAQPRRVGAAAAPCQ